MCFPPSVLSTNAVPSCTSGAPGTACGPAQWPNLVPLRSCMAGAWAWWRTVRQTALFAIHNHLELYKLDRLLWTLIDAGYGKYVKGILVGNLHKCGKGDARTFKLSRVHETLRKLTDGPVWIYCRFGHGLKFQRLLPLGTQVELTAKTIRTLESIVSE